MMHAPVAFAPSFRIARRHYENFPVASRLLPPGMRPHIAAIYAFARTADDFADEPGIADADRLRMLDEWERALSESDAPHRLRVPGEVDAVRLFDALHRTIETCELPVQLFRDLVSAFRQDVTKHRYATWTDLLDYCRRSADPVGRLVLRVAGHRDAALDRMSDAVCTALQLTNMWQDLDRDWRNGRLYVPLEDRARMGAREEDLDARLLTPEWRAMLAELAQRTRELFDAGRGVCDGVHGRLRWELRLTWLGGRRVLEKLERRGFDVFTRRPTIGILDLPVLLAEAANWPARPPD